jgi:hypothetical protein
MGAMKKVALGHKVQTDLVVAEKKSRELFLRFVYLQPTALNSVGEQTQVVKLTVGWLFVSESSVYEFLQCVNNDSSLRLSDVYITLSGHLWCVIMLMFRKLFGHGAFDDLNWKNASEFSCRVKSEEVALFEAAKKRVATEFPDQQFIESSFPWIFATNPTFVTENLPKPRDPSERDNVDTSFNVMLDMGRHFVRAFERYIFLVDELHRRFCELVLCDDVQENAKWFRALDIKSAQQIKDPHVYRIANWASHPKSEEAVANRKTTQTKSIYKMRGEAENLLKFARTYFGSESKLKSYKNVFEWSYSVFLRLQTQATRAECSGGNQVQRCQQTQLQAFPKGLLWLCVPPAEALFAWTKNALARDTMSSPLVVNILLQGKSRAVPTPNAKPSVATPLAIEELRVGRVTGGTRAELAATLGFWNFCADGASREDQHARRFFDRDVEVSADGGAWIKSAGKALCELLVGGAQVSPITRFVNPAVPDDFVVALDIANREMRSSCWQVIKSAAQRGRDLTSKDAKENARLRFEVLSYATNFYAHAGYLLQNEKHPCNPRTNTSTTSAQTAFLVTPRDVAVGIQNNLSPFFKLGDDLFDCFDVFLGTKQCGAEDSANTVSWLESSICFVRKQSKAPTTAGAVLLSKADFRKCCLVVVPNYLCDEDTFFGFVFRQCWARLAEHRFPENSPVFPRAVDLSTSLGNTGPLTTLLIGLEANKLASAALEDATKLIKTFLRWCEEECSVFCVKKMGEGNGAESVNTTSESGRNICTSHRGRDTSTRFMYHDLQNSKTGADTLFYVVQSVNVQVDEPFIAKEALELQPAGGFSCAAQDNSDVLAQETVACVLGRYFDRVSASFEKLRRHDDDTLMLNLFNGRKTFRLGVDSPLEAPMGLARNEGGHFYVVPPKGWRSWGVPPLRPARTPLDCFNCVGRAGTWQNTKKFDRVPQTLMPDQAVFGVSVGQIPAPGEIYYSVADPLDANDLLAAERQSLVDVLRVLVDDRRIPSGGLSCAQFRLIPTRTFEALASKTGDAAEYSLECLFTLERTGLVLQVTSKHEAKSYERWRTVGKHQDRTAELNLDFHLFNILGEPNDGFVDVHASFVCLAMVESPDEFCHTLWAAGIYDRSTNPFALYAQRTSEFALAEALLVAKGMATYVRAVESKISMVSTPIYQTLEEQHSALVQAVQKLIDERSKYPLEPWTLLSLQVVLRAFARVAWSCAYASTDGHASVMLPLLETLNNLADSDLQSSMGVCATADRISFEAETFHNFLMYATSGYTRAEDVYVAARPRLLTGATYKLQNSGEKRLCTTSKRRRDECRFDTTLCEELADSSVSSKRSRGGSHPLINLSNGVLKSSKVKEPNFLVGIDARRKYAQIKNMTFSTDINDAPLTGLFSKLEVHEVHHDRRTVPLQTVGICVMGLQPDDVREAVETEKFCFVVFDVIGISPDIAEVNLKVSSLAKMELEFNLNMMSERKTEVCEYETSSTTMTLYDNGHPVTKWFGRALANIATTTTRAGVRSTVATVVYSRDKLQASAKIWRKLNGLKVE